MKRKTPDDWKGIIQDQQTSGLTATEFCKLNNINPKYFSLRKRRLKTQDSPFVAAKVTKYPNAAISLTWNGMRIDFSQQMEITAVASLMKALNA